MRLPIGEFTAGVGIDQGHRHLPHGSPHLLMAPMAHQKYFFAFPVVFLGFIVYPSHQGTNGVDDPELPLSGLLEVLGGRAVGGKHHQRAWRYIFNSLHGDGTLLFQLGYHIRIVNNLMLYVHRRAVFLQAQLHHFYRPHHSGAKSPG